MVSAGLCLVRHPASSADDVVRALAAALLREGHVKPTFEAAARKRERTMPTGLPFAGGAVALPHAEPEHVISPAIAVATLVKPVTFREMGSPATALSVRLVVMPALTTKEQAGAGLARVIDLLRDDAFRRELEAAETPDAIVHAFTQRGLA